MVKKKTKVDELKEALDKRKKIEDRKEAEKRERSGDLDGFAKELESAEEEAKVHYDKLLRVMAEFDNFKKRSERERQEVVKFSNERLISELLPVLDDMDRVLEHVPEGASKELFDFVSGVELVAKHFLGVLTKFGLVEVKTDGEKFNPEFHEAVAHVESGEVETDHVIGCHRKGYLLGSRVLRAAMVTVSKGNGQ